MSPVNTIMLTGHQVESGLNISESAVRKLTKLNLLPYLQKKTQTRFPLDGVLKLIKWRSRTMPAGTYGLVCHISVGDGDLVPLPWCVPNRSVADNETISTLTKYVKANPAKYAQLPADSYFTKGFSISADKAESILGGKLLGSYAGFIAASATILMEVEEAYDGKRYFIVQPDTNDSYTKWYRAPESGPTVRVILP